VCFERFPSTMHVLNVSTCSRGSAVLVGSLLWSPPRDESVLRRAETVLQPRELGLLSLEFVLPPFALGAPALAVAGITVAVHAHPVIRGRVEVHDRLRDVGEQRAIMGDDDHAAVSRPQLRGQKLEAASIEVICGFVEEQEIVVGAEQARQTDSIALPDGEVVQAPGWLRFGVECFQRDLHPPFGIPRIEDFGVFQCGGVSFFGAGDACGE
jgi:hypothetical protein